MLPIALGFVAALGLSGLLLSQLMPRSSTPAPQSTATPSTEATTPQIAPPAQIPLPTLVCDEPPTQQPTGKPIVDSQGNQFYLPGTKVGKGTVIFKNGFRYDGDFQNNKRQGCGRLTYPSSDKTYQKYVGQFQNDLPNGLGTIFFANGGQYVGQVKTMQDGRMACQGEGVLVLTNGERIGGTWDQSKHQESQGKYACYELPP